MVSKPLNCDDPGDWEGGEKLDFTCTHFREVKKCEMCNSYMCYCFFSMIGCHNVFLAIFKLMILCQLEFLHVVHRFSHPRK